jgi:hypothetical protein
MQVITAPAGITVIVNGAARDLVAVLLGPSQRGQIGEPAKLLVKNAAGTGVEWVPAP